MTNAQGLKNSTLDPDKSSYGRKVDIGNVTLLKFLFCFGFPCGYLTASIGFACKVIGSQSKYLLGPRGAKELQYVKAHKRKD